MKYSFVEIGTADFDTLIQGAKDEVGLSVEPLKYYLNKLPDKPNVQKVNYAISDTEGSLDMFYLSEEIINRYNLPWWCRGCNSLGKPHVTVLNELHKRNLTEEVISRDPVKVVTPLQLIKEFDIESVEHLKIDTEGHDYIILNAWLDTTDILPDKITFESNVLSPIIEITKLIRRLVFLGYSITKCEDDTVVERRKDKLPDGRETMVSFLYDIGGEMDRFLCFAPYWSKFKIPVIIFTEPKYIKMIPKNCFIIPMLLSEMDSYRHLEKVNESYQGPMKGDRNFKYFPLYSILTWSKFDVIDYSIKVNPFKSDIFVWFDFGLWKFRAINTNFGNIYYIERIVKDLNDKIKICRLEYDVDNITNITLPGYAGGFMGGSKDKWEIFINRFRTERDKKISENLAYLEENIIGRIKKDDILDEYYGYYNSIINNIYKINADIRRVIDFIIKPAIEDGDYEFAKKVYNKINRERLLFEDMDIYEKFGRILSRL